MELPQCSTELARSVGLRDLAWSSRVPYGGGGSQGVGERPPPRLAPVAGAVAGARRGLLLGGRRFRRGDPRHRRHPGKRATATNCQPQRLSGRA